MCWQIERELIADARAPGLARTIVDSELTARLEPSVLTEMIDDALLVVSELATNAVRAGAATMTLGVAGHDTDVRIEVVDSAPGLPSLSGEDVHGVHGRGLMLVGAMAAIWGVTQLGDRKSVWALLQSDSDAPVSRESGAAGTSPLSVQ